MNNRHLRDLRQAALRRPHALTLSLGLVHFLTSRPQQEKAAFTARTAAPRLTEQTRGRSFSIALYMTVRGSPQNTVRRLTYRGQPRLLRSLISAVMAIAHSS